MPRIDPEVLDVYRNKRGFTDEQLADLCGITDRTIRRIREEGQGSWDSAKRLAGGLGIDLEVLISGIDPPAAALPPTIKRRFEVVIHLDVPFKQMDTQMKEEKKALLGKVICCLSEITILKVQDGSTILTLEMSEGDILRLLAAMVDRELDMLRISKIRIPDHSWIIIILALLNYDKEQLQPGRINVAVLSELLTDRDLQHSMKMKTKECLICKKID